MRVATANSYDNTISNLVKRQSELNAQQERISTGKRVQRASDDPVSAVLSETAQNRLSRVTADLRAVEASRTSLAQAESALGESGELIQQVRDLMVAAGNGTYGPREHRDLATQLEGLRDQMLSVANRKDSAGRTLFGGLGGSTTPFVDVYSAGGSAVSFEGLRGQEAAGNNSLPQALDGEAIWMRIPQGNGSFTLGLAASNTGGVRTDDAPPLRIGDPITLYSPTGADSAFGNLGGLEKTYRVGGVFKGERLMRYFSEQLAPGPIEHLNLPFGAVATAMATGTEVWLRSGPTVDAVRASIRSRVTSV